MGFDIPSTTGRHHHNGPELSEPDQGWQDNLVTLRVMA
jgi:hypothetical protein